MYTKVGTVRQRQKSEFVEAYSWGLRTHSRPRRSEVLRLMGTALREVFGGLAFASFNEITEETTRQKNVESTTHASDDNGKVGGSNGVGVSWDFVCNGE